MFDREFLENFGRTEKEIKTNGILVLIAVFFFFGVALFGTFDAWGLLLLSNVQRIAVLTVGFLGMFGCMIAVLFRVIF